MGKRARSRTRGLVRATAPSDPDHGNLPAPEDIEELQRLSDLDPSDDAVHIRYAEALQGAYRAAQGRTGAPCRCGSGRPYRGCCQVRDRRALRRFTDRQPLYRLRESLLDYFDDPELEPARRLALETWCGEEAPGPDEDLPDLDDPDAPHLFAYEWAFSMLSVHEGAPYDHCLLECFASNPAVPAALAAQAGDWFDCARWGLWQCSFPPAPGVWLTDLLSGLRRYVSMAPEQMEQPASMVAIGQIFPIDGVWRTGGALAFVSPKLGADLATVIIDSRDQTLAEQAPQRHRRRRGGSPPAPQAPSMLVLDELTSRLVGMALPTLMGLPEKPRSYATAAGR